jgi:hypothetical protein
MFVIGATAADMPAKLMAYVHHISKLPVEEVSAPENMLLEVFAPATVIVNSKGDIIYIHGRTGKYLEPSTEEFYPTSDRHHEPDSKRYRPSNC